MKRLGKKALVVVVGAVAALVFAAVALATITFNAEDGTGFVGKGDVQYTFGWNNAQLQANAEHVEFRAVSEVVTEQSWICTNSMNQHTQERQRTTTTSVEGLVDSLGRLKNQITGFNLLGYKEDDSTTSSETDGPPLNSCPSGPWTLTTPAGDPELISETSTLEVSDGATWTELLEKP
jgi:opacity protein-like surface antigen